MSLYTRSLARIARRPTHATQWQRPLIRSYSSTTDNDPEWFQRLRREMCRRPIQSTREFVSIQTDNKLIEALSTFLPAQWCRALRYSGAIAPIGHHLLWFNRTVPVGELLPDGTDTFHSPGEPWVRRLWAGGSLKVRTAEYFHNEKGFAVDSNVVCAERIVDVQLSGQGDAAKVIVDIERRFARLDELHTMPPEGPHSKDQFWDFRLKMLTSDWGGAMLREKRQLVFLKAKTPAELTAIRSGEFAPIKYLHPPREPDFSHKLIPTSSLLFRYSALTSNHHRIHIDREYTRNIEGHRNLLVHGPLTLTLMLQAVSGYIGAKTDGKRIVESIEYRNLAPLYCDEEMRICGKKSSFDDQIYKVWIEGPTGGVAVMGTVRTTTYPHKTVLQEDHTQHIHKGVKPPSGMGKEGTTLRLKGGLSTFRPPSLPESTAPRRMESTISRHSQHILERLSGTARIRIGKVQPRSLIRKFESNHDYDPDIVASKHSRFKREGVRSILKPRIIRVRRLRPSKVG